MLDSTPRSSTVDKMPLHNFSFWFHCHAAAGRKREGKFSSSLRTSLRCSAVCIIKIKTNSEKREREHSQKRASDVFRSLACRKLGKLSTQRRREKGKSIKFSQCGYVAVGAVEKFMLWYVEFWFFGKFLQPIEPTKPTKASAVLCFLLWNSFQGFCVEFRVVRFSLSSWSLKQQLAIN